MATENKLFVVSAVSEPSKLGVRIQELFHENNLPLSADQWLLAGPSTLTTKEVCEKLGITSSEDPTSSALVTSVSAYFGRAPQTVWEWINSKVGAANAGAAH